ncbi:UvrD-helicase domain-containing protein [Kribbella sp. NPDC050820]|uniref:UvrD-helicase domain-containing protein n=1 Tax=Kribbella sp. NPDC050820 TaxID=3155408 RepID=UPI0033D0C2F0
MSGLLLDDGQLAAVDISANTRQIVIAGPGSGKTEVVSALIEHLIDDEGVDPIDGMLVISFSNAAVHAADARLRTRVGTRPVNVQTMDSLAGEILRDLSTEDHGRLDFDRRIALATRLLSDESWGRIDDLEHMVVDEVQDIVGVRADFLLAIIAQLPTRAGFTLLGDPAQGIYDFQIRSDRNGRIPPSTTTSPELVKSVAALTETEVRHLTGQYRAVSRDTRAAAMLRAAVLPGGDPSLLDDFHAAVVPVGTVEDVVDLSKRWQGRTAFLTATNGQALLVAGALRTRTAVEVRRGAHQQVIAAWVARLLGDASTDTIARREFDRRTAERCPGLDPVILWRALRGVEVGKGTEIDLLRLAQRLRGPRPLTPELIDHPTTPFVVSTVHRAKGLEFDNVVLVDFPGHDWLEDTIDPGERLRARFVSLTRARQLISRADGPDDRFVRRFRKPGLHKERWYLGGHKPWMTFGFEIGVADIAPVSAGAADAQAHLTTQVSAGDPLELRLDRRESTLTVPVYTVFHGGVPVGHTSQRFGEDLASRIGTLTVKKGPWPTLTGARVESVATVVVDPHLGSAGRRGLRLAPIVAGLLNIDWKGTTPDD